MSLVRSGFNFIYNKYEIRSKTYTNTLHLKNGKINTNIYQDITKCQRKKKKKNPKKKKSRPILFGHNIFKTTAYLSMLIKYFHIKILPGITALWQELWVTDKGWEKTSRKLFFGPRTQCKNFNYV